MPAIYISKPYSGSSYVAGTTVPIVVSIDQSGLSSAYTAYGINIYINDVSLGITAVASNWTASTSFTFRYAGTFRIYGRLVNKTSGSYLGYQTGTSTISIIQSRPSDWSWTSTVSRNATIPNWTSGGVHYCKPLTATEWNGFLDRITQFMNYKGLTLGTSISNYYVTSNTRMEVNDVVIAADLINTMSPPTAVPSLPSVGGYITAAYINGLKNSLNSIT